MKSIRLVSIFFIRWILNSDCGLRPAFLCALTQFAVHPSDGPLGGYIRRHIHEPASFTEQEKHAAPLKALFGRQKSLILLAIGLMVISTAVNYMLNYIPTYATKTLHFGMGSL